MCQAANGRAKLPLSCEAAGTRATPELPADQSNLVHKVLQGFEVFSLIPFHDAVVISIREANKFFLRTGRPLIISLGV